MRKHTWPNVAWRRLCQLAAVQRLCHLWAPHLQPRARLVPGAGARPGGARWLRTDKHSNNALLARAGHPHRFLCGVPLQRTRASTPAVAVVRDDAQLGAPVADLARPVVKQRRGRAHQVGAPSGAERSEGNGRTMLSVRGRMMAPTPCGVVPSTRPCGCVCEGRALTCRFPTLTAPHPVRRAASPVVLPVCQSAQEADSLRRLAQTHLICQNGAADLGEQGAQQRESACTLDLVTNRLPVPALAAQTLEAAPPAPPIARQGAPRRWLSTLHNAAPTRSPHGRTFCLYSSSRKLMPTSW